MGKFKQWLRKKIKAFLQVEVTIHTPVTLDGKKIYELWEKQIMLKKL